MRHLGILTILFINHLASACAPATAPLSPRSQFQKQFPYTHKYLSYTSFKHPARGYKAAILKTMREYSYILSIENAQLMEFETQAKIVFERNKEPKFDVFEKPITKLLSVNGPLARLLHVVDPEFAKIRAQALSTRIK